MTDNQLLHRANGIRRIRECVKRIDMLPTDCGTIYGSVNLRKPKVSFSWAFKVPEGYEDLWKKK